MINIGFRQSKVDSFIFICLTNSRIVILAVYLDDILLTSSDTGEAKLYFILNLLSKELREKGEHIFLSWQKYALDDRL